MSNTKDIQYLAAGIPDLENYLLSKELYYPIGANLPQLTLGGMLLALIRLGNDGKKYEIQVEAVRSKWRTAWESKTSREVKARSALWMNYLAEYREDSKAAARLYPQNVRYRAMLSLLGETSHETDGFVRSIFQAGDFVWEVECAVNFDKNIFWFLFGTVK